MKKEGEDLRNYCDPLEDYVSGRLRESNHEFCQKYAELARKYVRVGLQAHEWQLEEILKGDDTKIKDHGVEDKWGFMERLSISLKEGLQAFDDLFGEKWRYD